MSDIKSPEDRSKNMAAIHSKDTRPEIVLRRALWAKGFRYRKNYRLLPGKPDIVLPKYKICIFIDSEFFHGKGFYSGYESRKYSSLEEQLKHSNHSEFWLEKITKNMERDQQVNCLLAQQGWKVLRFWSKDVLKNVDQCLLDIEDAVRAV